MEAEQVKLLRQLAGASTRDHLHNEVFVQKFEQTKTIKDIEKYRLLVTNSMEQRPS
jgi:hypothetical protein